MRFAQGFIVTPDGRRLAYAECGAVGGAPIFYLHGAIGSPLTCDDDVAAAVRALDVRLIALHRPGFAGSDPLPGRTLLDGADDVARVADALGIQRFAVVGVSAGGPYAIACAQRLGQRLTTAAAVSSLSPLCAPAEVPGLPHGIRLALRAIAAAPRTATAIGDAGVALTARCGRLRRAVVALGAPEAAVAGFLAAATDGVGGLVADHLISRLPWGFDLADVRGEVHVWHGMADHLVPADHALQLVASLPRSRVFLDPAEGHFFFRRRARDILAPLAEASRPELSARV